MSDEKRRRGSRKECKGRRGEESVEEGVEGRLMNEKSKKRIEKGCEGGSFIGEKRFKKSRKGV